VSLNESASALFQVNDITDSVTRHEVADTGRSARQQYGGGSLRTVVPSPYNDRAHLTPKEYRDHDGGPWGKTPVVRPQFRPVPNKWVVAPALGAASPAVCVFPRRLSNNVSFSPEVHLAFAACWTPVIARFTELFLVDVDKKGNMPEYNQEQHWVCTFKGKTSTGTTAVTLRLRVNNTGDTLEGWAMYLPDTDHVLSFVDFPPPPSSRVGFDSSSAIVVNGALTAFDPDNVKVLFSKLDDSVERETRIQRAAQAWRLFILDAKRRSATTVESINNIRQSVYYRTCHPQTSYLHDPVACKSDCLLLVCSQSSSPTSRVRKTSGKW